MDSSRKSLEQRLAALLSISIDDDREYVTDVLGSLVEIGDNPDDVEEYLSNFGASGGYDLQQFAQDVKKFNMGEDISSTEIKETDKSRATKIEAKPKAKILDEAAAQREEIKRRELEARGKQREEQDLLRKKKGEEEEQRRREAAAAAAAKKKQSQWGKKTGAAVKLDQKANIQSSMGKTEVKQTPSKQAPKEAAPKQKEPISQKTKKQQSIPEKGNPKKMPCGCYGNKHKPLTNCLRCGRISCEIEGIDDYCHFCGYYIADFSSQVGTTSDAKANSALQHKERLLEFDRTSAARTHIHDDQEDYFVASSSMWASEQEQGDARAMEENRQKKLHERQRKKLNINF